MKKLLTVLLLLVTPVFALGKTITIGEFLDQYTAIKDVPNSSQYIELNYNNFPSGTYEYKVLQKVVYLDLIPNMNIKFPYYTPISEESASAMLKKFEGLSFNPTPDKLLSDDAMRAMLGFVKAHSNNNGSAPVELSLNRQYEVTANKEFMVLEDVYNKLTKQHFDNEHMDKQKLVHGAIKGMAEASGDDYTAYFPPTDSESFIDNMNGTFVGIGAYVEMPQPGKFIISAPIEGSPAEEAGLKAGDQVTMVDDFMITESVTTNEAISHVKGEQGTTVQLTIIRNGQQMVVPVVRDIITIAPVSSEELPSSTLLIDINMFSENIYEEFVKALINHKAMDKKRLIIDLQDNPGGSLDEVASILDHFVPAGQPTVITKDIIYEDTFKAKQIPDSLYMGDKEVIMLING